MSKKRFTDSDIWKKKWFRKLPVKMKCAWFYLKDNCDHVGVWEIDTELLSFQLGEDVSIEEILKNFEDEIVLVHNGKRLFLKSFCLFQYGKLQATNNAHKSYIAKLQAHGLAQCEKTQGLTSPSQAPEENCSGDKEKEKEKDKVKDKEKEKEISSVAPKKSARKNYTPEQKAMAKAVREGYKHSYLERWGIEPTWAAAQNSLVYQLISQVGSEEAVRIARAYPSYNDPWHIGQKHPFKLLVAQLDKVRVEITNPQRMLDATRAKQQINHELKRTEGQDTIAQTMRHIVENDQGRIE